MKAIYEASWVGVRGTHVWIRNGAWGYQCLRCDIQSGKKDPNDLPKGGCK